MDGGCPTRKHWSGNVEAEEGRRPEGPREERHLLGRPHAVRRCNTLATADSTYPIEAARMDSDDMGGGTRQCVCGWGGDGACDVAQDGAQQENGQPCIAGGLVRRG